MKESQHYLDNPKDADKGVERVTRRVYSHNSLGTFDVEAATYDQVIIEAPLQIILVFYCSDSQSFINRPLMVTMRTPGHDELLVSGLLLASSVIKCKEDITRCSHIEAHVIEVTLSKMIVLDWSQLQRQGVSTSSCGACGQQQIKQLAIYQSAVSNEQEHWLNPSDILNLPTQLKTLQPHFKETGGVHAAGLWHHDGFLVAHEDVGRHNAVDKVIGSKLAIKNAATDLVLVLSGRISFELVQKAIMADIPVIVAVGAPSNLAVALAKQFNITLIGFAKSQQFNLYSGEFRLI